MKEGKQVIYDQAIERSEVKYTTMCAEALASMGRWAVDIKGENCVYPDSLSPRFNKACV